MSPLQGARVPSKFGQLSFISVHRLRDNSGLDCSLLGAIRLHYTHLRLGLVLGSGLGLGLGLGLVLGLGVGLALVFSET